MTWLLPFLPFFVILFVVVSVVRAAVKAAKNTTAAKPPLRPSPANFDPAMAERTRRIQEEIRRKIAERRGHPLQRVEPTFQAEEIPPPPPLLPVVSSASTAAVLERQEQLAEQMRALEAARVAERRKAAGLATVARETDTAVASAVTARDELLADLRGPTSLRRAILLREVLGPPVGLR